MDDSETEVSSFPASDTQETVSEDLNLTHEDITCVSEQIRTQSSRPAVKNVSKRKGIFSAIGELKKLHEVINKDIPLATQEEDRFDVFGKSVAMQLRALSYERGMIGQARIQNILTELSIENYRCNNMSVCTETSSECSTSGFPTNISEVDGDDILSTAITLTLSNE